MGLAIPGAGSRPPTPQSTNSRGSRAAAQGAGQSSRGGYGHGVPLSVEGVAAELMSKLDITGTDDMVIDMTLTFNNGLTITLKPIGNRFSYCPLRDTNWDPFMIMHANKNIPSRWGRPPLQNGETQPGPCLYCKKYIMGRTSSHEFRM